MSNSNNKRRSSSSSLNNGLSGDGSGGLSSAVVGDALRSQLVHCGMHGTSLKVKSVISKWEGGEVGVVKMVNVLNVGGGGCWWRMVNG